MKQSTAHVMTQDLKPGMHLLAPGAQYEDEIVTAEPIELPNRYGPATIYRVPVIRKSSRFDRYRETFIFAGAIAQHIVSFR